MIGVVDSWLNAPSQRYGNFENRDRPIDENDENGQLLLDIGVVVGGGLFMATCCARRTLISFMILIYSAVPCISRWMPSRSESWLEFAIGCARLSKGLLVLGLDNKRLRRCIEY